MSVINVYRINDEEWWAAETLQDAIKACCEECDLPEDEATNEPYQLTDEQMASYLMYEVNHDWREERDEPPTFKEYLEFRVQRGDTFPCLFASTDY